ncbi:MAG: type I-C CRISPR-associated protein Cas8c/Csd1, partial [Hyphomicrobiales bacterium]|nr:type I-C CRISPR-associated protein Cas8c/Csd1 [Hyphomicrobiales bacterium]
GHEQGDNAPVSEAAAFAYTTALNRFLERDSSHRVQIGDASTVFWADAEDAAAAAIAENMCSIMFNGDEVGADEDSGDSDEDARAEETALNTASTKDVLAKLDRIRKGEPLAQVEPKLAHGVRFHVLGLAPNAARLSVRFYFEDDFGVLAENYRNYCQDMAVDPPDRSPNPPLWRYLLELAVQRKRENVPPKIAGDWMRAILGGTQYPHTLLTSALMRIRSDGTVNALRVSMLKAVLIRNYNMEAPVSLDPDNRNKGYILGRLFAVYEETQRAALGNNVNATIKDKFYSSASATPRKVFAMLNSGSANHLSKVAKTNRGRSVNLGKLLDDIMAVMSPADDPFPASFSAQEQAMFGLGYHHQHAEFFKSKNANHAEDEANSDDNA